MEKVNRLGWTDGFAFTSYGVRVGVRTNNSAILEKLPELFPPGSRLSRNLAVEHLYSLLIGGEGSRPGVRRFNLLYANAENVARSLNVEDVLDRFEAELKLHVAEAARRRLFVHAGAVGWKGQAIIVPGRSLSGKTTLIKELVERGATYYSDEYAVLDARGLVHPYNKPLAIRDSINAKQLKCPVESLGGRPGVKPLPVGLVVVSEYSEGARWRPLQLSAGQGALALLANTVSARRQPETALATLQRIALRAVFLKGKRGEVGETVEPILRYMEERAAV